MPDLHSRIAVELDRRLAVARAATKAKPGLWLAYPTHDGQQWTGHSHVRAKEETAEKSISRPVAYLIADSLDLQPSAFGGDPPPPAATAEHIAMAAPADAERRYSAALRVLNRHRPFDADGQSACTACTDMDRWVESGVAMAADCSEIEDLAASLGLDITEGSTTDG